FVWTGAMAISALVLLPERGLERRHRAVVDRTVRHRHYQLVGLALIMQRRRTLNARTRSDKTFCRELSLRFARERVPGSADLGEVGAAQQAAQRARVICSRSAYSNPNDENNPADGGTTTRPMPSADAIAAANSGPLPPKANSAKSRGSRPRSVDTD